MDRERLTELLQDPSQVAKEDLGDLRSMTERFPWFSGAHLLLAVGEHAEGDVLSNDPARTPAAYLPSRAVLFDLTQADATPAPAPMHVVKDAPTPPITEEVVPATPIAEEPATTVVEDAVRDPEMAAPEFVAPPETAVEIDPVAPEPAPPNTGDPSPDPLDSQIRAAAWIGSYDLANALPPVPVSPPDEMVGGIQAQPEASPALTQPSTPPVLPEIPVTGSVKRSPTIPKASRLRFTEWLSASSEDLQNGSPTAESPKSAEAVQPFVSAVIATLEDGSLPDPKEIIERFIQRAVPPATPVKAEFFNPQHAAKRSLQDDGLVSETLAKIYEKQGDIAKAIQTYARLAIIHPEKSVYFAALSKALEGRSNK